MEDEPRPLPAEALVGKDELDEDDEMVLSGDDLVTEASGDASDAEDEREAP